MKHARKVVTDDSLDKGGRVNFKYLPLRERGESEKLKLVSAIFYQTFTFQQMIALKKL